MAHVDPVFTLADLDRWSFAGTALAVLGFPIKHSISPAMHNSALADMAALNPRFAEWKYFRFEVKPEELPQALTRFHEKQFRGLNLTVPHKIIAFDCIAEIDPAARLIHAVNTLLWKKDGWFGYNTDGYGLATGLREDLGRDLARAPVVLLGAGGAARGAGVECVARECSSLWIGNRTRERAEALAQDLRLISKGTSLHVFDPAGALDQLPSDAIVINATSAGLNPTDPLPLDLSRMPRASAVYDMIYNPPRTPLLALAESLGVPFANGLSMLIHQGARALEIWSEQKVPVAAMRRGAASVLGR